MGWYVAWVPGLDHGSYPAGIHEDWSHSEKEIQICPNLRTP